MFKIYGSTFFLIVSVFIISNNIALDISVNVSDNDSCLSLKHFWKSTGFCPPDPKTKINEFLMSKDEKFNLALIGALPNRGIKHVRIHWLLNLITIRFDNGIPTYDFSKLDSFLEWIHKQKLYLGFEIMGVPSMLENNGTSINYNEIFPNFYENVYRFWYEIVKNVARRYIDIFGTLYVKKWRFETWNEPDLENYNLLNFTIKDYLTYVQASADGLRDALTGEDYPWFKFGGPAGLFKTPKNHPLCWGLLRYCNDSTWHTCPIQFISLHKKGDGTAKGVIHKSSELLDLIRSEFLNIPQIPIANDEADILTNWSESVDWRGDVRYAAMIVEVIIDFFKKFVVNRNMKIEVLSNDNAFLNYHPFYFTQRTLLTRFQMNNTKPPHVQFIKKPAYCAMGLLSLLGDKYIKESASSPHPLIKFLLSKSETYKNRPATVSLVITYVNNTEESSSKATMKRINVIFNNLPDPDSKYVIYVLDNLLTNPFRLWKRSGSPVFPGKKLYEKMRNVEEPFRLLGPSPIVNSTLKVQMNLTLPTVALVHICSRSSEPPGRVTHLKAYNVTRNEVLLIWKDTKVCTKCIRTYEVEFQPEKDEQKLQNDSKLAEFRRVNGRDTIFLSYHHVATGHSTRDATRGRYRVRAVDYWDKAGKYSKVLTYPSI